MEFTPFPFRDEENSLQAVIQTINKVEFSDSPYTHKSLSALYELASDPQHDSLPINPSLLLEYGMINGTTSAVIGMGCAQINDGFLITVIDPSAFQIGIFKYATELWKQNNLFEPSEDHSCGDIAPIICNSGWFNYIAGFRIRLCYIEGQRHDQEDIAIQISMEIEDALRLLKDGHVDGGWLILNGHGKNKAVTNTINNLVTQYAHFFTQQHKVDSMIYLCCGGENIGPHESLRIKK